MGTELVTGEDGRVRPAWAAHDPLLRDYYDHEWGAPVTDERGLYERLCLEAFQAGLSWVTILRKRPAFRRAFAGFDVDRVACFGPADVERLLADEAIVRNRRKIEAAITNARATRTLRDRGGLPRLVWSFRPPARPRPTSTAEVPARTPQSEALAKALRAEGFVFVGPTTVYAMMQAVGVVDDRLEGAADLVESPAGGAPN
ncbi:DNA-3-methyladenine glycosylase I [Propionibacterium australiense]|uniref:DNA-3-methyladenine glycosylase I n=1 Tax=Propionibacterium australiense TaxID=119981 RepID=A0A383S9A7_9ACTN|nr:DNA-3-methyladenine glycosylase I [Propionibacterium australiense]RLP06290.1 DNA-3-methyladenine glycosylase I [Propionibacterium australiense]SYZ34497.1 DNA-3-methyladenine glycosylase I [Propionibacterium australiense]VEH88995.1 DNA-3-methyladenine glycosylase 1 [Propionibacterium australiense]